LRRRPRPTLGCGAKERRRRRILVEKLLVTQLVKKFPDFYRIRRFIAVLIRAH
jgi:hypothetical protein